MQPKDMPPKKFFPHIIPSQEVAKLNPDHKEPHMVFISHELSRRMKSQLEKENRSFNDFIQEVCVEYLNKIENEELATKKYLSFSDMLQAADDISYGWYYNEEDIADMAKKGKK